MTICLMVDLDPQGIPIQFGSMSRPMSRENSPLSPIGDMPRDCEVT